MYEAEKLSFENALDYFREYGFKINEMKSQGEKTVPIEHFETLLNWTIDFTSEVRDKVFA